MSFPTFDYTPPQACPSCGKMLPLSPGSSYRVCSSCQSVLKKTGGGFSVEVQNGILPEDMTPLRLGTRGVWQGNNFEIKGRVRFDFMQGYCNQWYIVYNNGKWGWLQEMYGDYCILQDTPLPVAPATLSRAKPGKKVKFTGFEFEFTLQAMYNGTRFTCEGELPELPPNPPAWIRLEYCYVDRAVIIHTYSKDKIIALQGNYVQTDQLKLTGLRSSAEWGVKG